MIGAMPDNRPLLVRFLNPGGVAIPCNALACVALVLPTLRALAEALGVDCNALTEERQGNKKARRLRGK
jgi:hypothetical protein